MNIEEQLPPDLEAIVQKHVTDSQPNEGILSDFSIWAAGDTEHLADIKEQHYADLTPEDFEAMVGRIRQIELRRAEIQGQILNEMNIETGSIDRIATLIRWAAGNTNHLQETREADFPNWTPQDFQTGLVILKDLDERARKAPDAME